jgi:hypothetical protein
MGAFIISTCVANVAVEKGVVPSALPMRRFNANLSEASDKG